MNNTQGDVKSIFGKALDIDSNASRAAFLDEACVGNDALRAEVESLLAALQDAGSYMETPVVGRTVDIPAEPPLADTPGTQIGPYKLLQQIGEGGMGAVFMAEQTHPVQRRVALKLIKAGLDSRQVIARFEAERQALALMDHVNIARVFDAGATETGRPYFVMELIHGVPITRYCDDNRLTPRQRLELFVPVCQAIQHAHQKGIIHRDIKPSNVMVCLYDGKPVPKVIDFGVAKATEQTLTERTMFTEIGQVVGTLEYMSPEQAELNQLDIDTRSDTYSLGVLLYELLTGTTPLERKRFKEAAILETLRLIREEEPPKPSTRLSTAEGLPSIAANRGLEPKQLSGHVRGELDWIVMKCLEKDRNRRYETANGLTRDIERYLQDEPVQACPPSALYRFRKFASKYRMSLGVAGAFVVLLVAGTIVSAWQAVRATRAEEVATVERDRTSKEYQRAENALGEAKGNLQRADQNLGLALEALDELYMKDVENRIFREHRMTEAERQSLKHGLEFYERFAEQNSGHPELQGVMAKAYRRAGFLRLDLKDWQEAQADFGKAIPVLEQLADDSAESASNRHDLARCCYGLSHGLIKEGRYRQAEPRCRRAIALLEKLAVEFPHEPKYRVELGHSLLLLGKGGGQGDDGILSSTGRLEEAEKAASEALKLFEALAAEYPNQRFYRQETAFSHRQLSSIFANTGRADLATASRRQAIALYTDLVAEAPASSFYRRELAYSCNILGNQLRANQQDAEAEDAYRQAIALYSKLASEFNDERDRGGLGSAYEHLGLLRKKAGQLDEATAHLRSALAVWEKLVDAFSKADHRGHWSHTHGVLVEVVLARANEAEKDTSRSQAERQAAAQTFRDEASELVRDGIKKGHLTGLVSFNLTDLPEAEPLLIEKLAEQTRMHGPEHLHTSYAMHRLALNYLRWGKYDKAEPLFRACLPIRDKEESDHWTTFNTRVRLGAALLGQQKYAEAEPFLIEGYEGIKQRESQIPSSEKYALTDAVNWLVELYDAWGQQDKADEWRKKLEAAKAESNERSQ